jgi:hypothetical protein
MPPNFSPKTIFLVQNAASHPLVTALRRGIYSVLTDKRDSDLSFRTISPQEAREIMKMLPGSRSKDEPTLFLRLKPAHYDPRRSETSKLQVRFSGGMIETEFLNDTYARTASSNGCSYTWSSNAPILLQERAPFPNAPFATLTIKIPRALFGSIRPATLNALTDFTTETAYHILGTQPFTHPTLHPVIFLCPQGKPEADGQKPLELARAISRQVLKKLSRIDLGIHPSRLFLISDSDLPSMMQTIPQAVPFALKVIPPTLSEPPIRILCNPEDMARATYLTNMILAIANEVDPKLSVHIGNIRTDPVRDMNSVHIQLNMALTEKLTPLQAEHLITAFANGMVAFLPKTASQYASSQGT